MTNDEKIKQIRLLATYHATTPTDLDLLSDLQNILNDEIVMTFIQSDGGPVERIYKIRDLVPLM